MKKILKTILIILLVLVVIVAGYVAYVFISYHRIPDNQVLDVEAQQNAKAQAGMEYKVLSWNLGFGAYSRDFSFFMDGGKHSWAYSKDEVIRNITASAGRAADQAPDFILFQEVDTDSTRAYHVNEALLLADNLPGYGYVQACNYDSPFLFYPFTQPHGKSVAELMTMTAFHADSALRRSLPVETGFMKFLDLDRCYSITDIPVDNGKTLRLYNLHLSAYTSDGTIADEPIDMLLADMAKDYAAGNYIIAGGDFNKDLLGDSSVYFGVSAGEQTWAQPFPTDKLPDYLSLQAPLDENAPVPSCRNCDTGYIPGQTFVLVVDGFLVSDNVTVLEKHVIDADFETSDHNPVSMTFVLN